MSDLYKSFVVWCGVTLALLGCTLKTPTVEFNTTSQTVQESEGTASVVVSLSAEAALAVRVPYTLSGTASGGGTPSDDYSGADGVLTIPIGSKSASIDFPLIAHGGVLPDRTLIVTLGEPENGVLGSDTVQTVTISNSGAPPPSSVNASFPWSGVVGACPTNIIDIPLFLDGAQTAPSILNFGLSVTAPGLSDGFEYQVISSTIAPTPGPLTPSAPSTNILAMPNGGSVVFAVLVVDCGAINPGDTITLSVTAAPGTTVGPNSSVTVSF